MTATDVLRRMLDERGVEWQEVDGHTLWWGESVHHQASAYSNILFGESERVHLSAMVTPEQAIAATLGVRTCHDVGRYCFTCSECGHTMSEPHHMFNRSDPNVIPNFCPNCGARVIGSTTNDVDVEVDGG